MDRAVLLQHLAQAERHVAEGDQHLLRQEELIAELDRDGHDTEKARVILDTLRETQAFASTRPRSHHERVGAMRPPQLASVGR
jgi:hypothetical protein